MLNTDKCVQFVFNVKRILMLNTNERQKKKNLKYILVRNVPESMIKNFLGLTNQFKL